jgi:hypothetical protein
MNGMAMAAYENGMKMAIVASMAANNGCWLSA